MIAKVVFPKPPGNEFDYKIPDGLKILKGQRVIVSFRNTKRIGYVVSLADGMYNAKFEMKEIGGVLDEKPLIDESTFKFAESLAEYYFVGIGEILNLIIPPKYVLSISDIKSFSTAVDAEFTPIISGLKPGIYAACLGSSERYKFYRDKIADVINLKKSALLVMPTLSDLLWAQSFFADLKPITWHSDTGLQKQQGAFEKIMSAESAFVISTRRGLFLPINNLHTIIVDREYDYAHKDSQTPYYHSREVAIAKSRFFNVNVIFGGLVFSTQVYAMIKNDTIRVFPWLQNKTIQTITTSLPAVYRKNPYNFITKSSNKRAALFDGLWDDFDRSYAVGRAAVIHYPRRGFLTGFYCVGCKTILKCPDCEVAVTSFKADEKNKLKCDYCGKEFPQPPVCPVCKSINIYPLSFGTQKVEETIKKRYPFSKIVRYDFDSKKSVADKTDADFIIATHPPPKHKIIKEVGLVVVLNADFDFFHPEYFSNEKIFLKLADYYDLILSTAPDSKMIVETGFENYYVFKSNYADFYNEELKNRKKLKYPPYSRLLELNIYGKNVGKIEKYVGEIESSLQEMIGVEKSDIEIIGPSKSKLKKQTFGWKILLKGTGDFRPLISLIKGHKKSAIKIKIDASI